MGSSHWRQSASVEVQNHRYRRYRWVRCRSLRGWAVAGLPLVAVLNEAMARNRTALQGSAAFPPGFRCAQTQGLHASSRGIGPEGPIRTGDRLRRRGRAICERLRWCGGANWDRPRRRGRTDCDCVRRRGRTVGNGVRRRGWACCDRLRTRRPKRKRSRERVRWRNEAEIREDKEARRSDAGGIVEKRRRRHRGGQRVVARTRDGECFR